MNSKARELLAALQREIDHDRPASATLWQLWRPFWKTEARHIRSWKRSRAAASRFLFTRVNGRRLGAWPALEVTNIVAEEYRDARKRTVTNRRRPPAEATINRELIVLRRMLAWAAEQRPALLPYSPLANLRLAPERNIRKTKIRSDDEFARLVAHMGPVCYAYTVAMFDRGFRRMEVYRLSWPEIDLRGRTVELPGERTKNGKPRRVRLSPRTVEAIDRLPRVSEWVFANTRRYIDGHKHRCFGKPMSPRYLDKLFDEAVKKSGLLGIDGESITRHTLKHSFIYRARRQWKLSRAVIKKMTGNITDSAFDRYGIVDDEELDEAFDSLDELQAAPVKAAGSRRRPLHARPPDTTEPDIEPEHLRSATNT